MTRRRALVAFAAFAESRQTLFDGTDLRNFRTPSRITGPGVSWRIRDGAIESMPDARRQCDLWTAEEYQSFDLEFEWKVAPGGNSGVKYLVQATAT